MFILPGMSALPRFHWKGVAGSLGQTFILQVYIHLTSVQSAYFIQAMLAVLTMGFLCLLKEILP
jgi:hypothetical protein